MRSIESIIHAESLLWAREHLRVEDLPTFGDLLKEIDPVTLARVVVDCHDDKGMDKGSSAYLAELSKVLRSIEEMRKLGTSHTGEETIFLPKVEFREWGRNTIKYSLSLRRFHMPRTMSTGNKRPPLVPSDRGWPAP